MIKCKQFPGDVRRTYSNCMKKKGKLMWKSKNRLQNGLTVGRQEKLFFFIYSVRTKNLLWD